MRIFVIAALTACSATPAMAQDCVAQLAAITDTFAEAGAFRAVGTMGDASGVYDMNVDLVPAGIANGPAIHSSGSGPMGDVDSVFVGEVGQVTIGGETQTLPPSAVADQLTWGFDTFGPNIGPDGAVACEAGEGTLVTFTYEGSFFGGSGTHTLVADTATSLPRSLAVDAEINGTPFKIAFDYDFDAVVEIVAPQ